MHPLLVLLAFSMAAVVIYLVVLAALTAVSLVDKDQADAHPAPHRDATGSEERVHACC